VRNLFPVSAWLLASDLRRFESFSTQVLWFCPASSRPPPHGAEGTWVLRSTVGVLLDVVLSTSNDCSAHAEIRALPPVRTRLGAHAFLFDCNSVQALQQRSTHRAQHRACSSGGEVFRRARRGENQPDPDFRSLDTVKPEDCCGVCDGIAAR
jgi:hypothetical protein